MRFTTLLLCTLVPFATYAQLSIDDADTTYTIDFDNTVDGVNEGQYDGSGLDPNPDPGQLDGNAWEIIGLSDGDHNFGDTHTSGDFARETSPGGEITGGLYAFEVSGGNYAFGFQPSGPDLTPGYITLKVANNTGNYIHAIDLSYDIHVMNDEPRGNDLNFSWSLDNSNFFSESSLDFTSTETAAGSPSWAQHDRSQNIGMLIPPGSNFYLRWQTDDNLGSGARDEFVLDDIEIEASIVSVGNPLIISEIMANPEIDENGNSFPNENDPEWFEVFNNSDHSISVNGLLLEDNSDSIVISNANPIPSGAYYVFGRDTGSNNGPYVEDYIYGTIAFSNNGDSIAIKYPDDDKLIDVVDFTSWYATLPNGNSLVFTGTLGDDNNDPSFWTESAEREPTYGGSHSLADNGSPGTPGMQGQLLPLWITSLDGTYYNGEVQLTWETEQAAGIEKFEVELSRDGATFQKIGEVPAEPERLNYQFAKAHDLSKTAYARIRQVDKAGTFFYTDMITLQPNPDQSFVVYPNPATNHLHILTEAVLAGAAYQIVDASGRLLRSGKLTAHPIDVSELPSGLYHLRVASSQWIFNNTFLKH